MNRASAGHGRLLVVDDDRLVRETVSRALVAAGYDVTEASEGEHALRALEEASTDAMVVDIFMPNKDGIELIREVRRRWPSVRILVMSGGGQKINRDMLAAARKLGADATLDKPFRPSDLIATIRRLLEREP